MSKLHIAEIPESLQVIDELASNKLKIIVNNYRVLMEDVIKQTEFLIEETTNKPLILYNTCFLIELGLKYYLTLKLSIDNIRNIENKGHNISDFIDISKKQGLDTEELVFLLNKFIDNENRRLDLKNYYNYKYNRLKGEVNIIFDFEFSEKEKNNVKEIIVWIRQNILIL